MIDSCNYRSAALPDSPSSGILLLPHSSKQSRSGSVSVVPTACGEGGKLILYRAVGGWVCVWTTLHLQSESRAQWGHTKVHFPFGRQPFMLSLRRATHPHQCLSPSDSLCEGATSVGIQPTHNIQNQLGWDLMWNFLCCSWYLSEEQDSDGGRHPNTQLVD